MNMKKKVLIIGNGFDLYHGLPTRYSDFLFLAEHWDGFYKRYLESSLHAIGEVGTLEIQLEQGKLCENSLEDFIKHKNLLNGEKIEFLNNNLKNNKWIQYFLDVTIEGQNWIDFEEEIDNVLKNIHAYFDDLPNLKSTTIIESHYDNDIINTIKHFKDLMPGIKLGLASMENLSPRQLDKQERELIKALRKELDVLIKCFQYYLSEFVDNIRCKVYSEQVKALDDIYLLNFNYTYTHERVYGRHRISHHPIHGDLSNGNMVMGVLDNDLPYEEEYLAFQKSVQRVTSSSGGYYKDWVVKPRSRDLSDEGVDAYVFGHSLGKFDQTVLDYFFKNDYVNKVTIFYYSDVIKESLVEILAKYLGMGVLEEKCDSGAIVFEKLKEPVCNSL